MAHSPNINKNRGYANWSVYAVAIALTLIACAVAVVLRLFSTSDLPFQTFAALIGVIITAIITGILLKGQSDAERRQKEQAEIFKEKLATYNRFLDSLRKYVTESNENNKKDVVFNAMTLRMHSKALVIDALDDNIIKIIGRGSDIETRELVIALNAIACIFGRELYQEETGSDTCIDSLASAIEDGQLEPTMAEKDVEMAEEVNEDDALGDSKVMAWCDKVAMLKAQGWAMTQSEDAFTLTSASTPTVISIYRKKGKYVVEATKEGDSDFSQTLKNNFKGSRRYGTWWRELPISNYGVKEGTLMSQLPANDRARASVIKWIDKLTNFTASQH